MLHISAVALLATLGQAASDSARPLDQTDRAPRFLSEEDFVVYQKTGWYATLSYEDYVRNISDLSKTFFDEMVEDPLYECYLDTGVCDYDYYVEGSGYNGKDDVQPHQIVTRDYINKVCSADNAEFVRCAVWEPTNTEYLEFNVA